MIISPPFLRANNYRETDEAWIEKMMPVNPDRGYPLNEPTSWHGGIHITHTDSTPTPEMIRAIADGEVVSFRAPVILPFSWARRKGINFLK